MSLPSTVPSISHPAGPRRSTALLVLTGLWLLLYFAALFTPPLLDDADATHASAARHMALTGDLVTLRVNGIRYLEKPPLPYWVVALSLRLFGFNAFAVHLPESLSILFLALLGYRWSRETFGLRSAFYTGLGILTSAGVFLFTRVFIPEAPLSLLLALSLYCFFQALLTSDPDAKAQALDTTSGPADLSAHSSHRIRSKRLASLALRMQRSRAGASRLLSVSYPYLMWAFLAFAVLTKGLVSLVFFFGTIAAYLVITGEHRNWRALKPLPGILLFLLIAAPWHILAGLRNTGGMNGHGFFWFYFINEHFLRFLGRRYPMDYNKLPGYLYWSLHLVWLFPWSLFAPLPIIVLVRWWRGRTSLHTRLTLTSSGRSILLLSLFSALVLLFFSLSTNQEYYTFPVYLPVLILISAALSRAEDAFASDSTSRRWISTAHVALTGLGLAIASALAYGLWTSRHLPFVPDIGDLLAHRGVGDYTLSMSHLFDLTAPSFAALRLPATLATLAFAFGPFIAWIFRQHRRHLAATSTIALTSAIFLIAAHIAFVRFSPMLSSKIFVDKIEELHELSAVDRSTEIILYGDQAYGSSIPFYLGEQALLVNGRSSSMLFGSTFQDAPPIFLSDADLLRIWGTGERKILFVPLEKRDDVDRLLGNHKILLKESSGKALFTDRPLDPPQEQPQERTSTSDQAPQDHASL